MIFGCPTHSFCVSDLELILRSRRSLSVSHDVQQFRQLRSFQPASMWKPVQTQETNGDHTWLSVTFGGLNPSLVNQNSLLWKMVIHVNDIYIYIHDIPIKDMVMFNSYAKLPEGKPTNFIIFGGFPNSTTEFSMWHWRLSPSSEIMKRSSYLAAWAATTIPVSQWGRCNAHGDIICHPPSNIDPENQDF